MKVLLIEDSKVLAKSISHGLKHLKYQVSCFHDGQAGLDAALSGEYALIILDLKLPTLSGWDILKTLRDKNLDCAILILSANSEMDAKIKGLQVGADDYMTKPFSFDELAARVNNMARRLTGVHSNVLSFGQVELNLAFKKLTVNGDDLALTSSEYMIIEYIALKQGKPVSVDSLLGNVFDIDSKTSKNSIEAHLSSVRKKLAEKGIKNLVVHKRGIGYFIQESVAE